MKEYHLKTKEYHNKNMREHYLKKKEHYQEQQKNTMANPKQKNSHEIVITIDITQILILEYQNFVEAGFFGL